MVEIDNSKKNIITLFTLMIIILFFIYKGFVSDNSIYFKEYKNYLININTSNYYLNKIKKYKLNNINTEKNKNKKIKNKEEIKDILLKIKSLIDISINNNQKIINNLNNININYTDKEQLKKVIDNALKDIENTNKNDKNIKNIIKSYIDNLKNN